ncbi:MAG: T9SS type A sorting domain-containing protein [Bacteroidetes bacterium]|nr:T9SS type A sorting domain-containing protein [Bacteroidota bacterium]
MKKLFLLIMSGCAALSSTAQSQNIPFAPKANNVAKEAVVERNLIYKDAPLYKMGTANKTTAGGKRWYSQYDLVNNYIPGNQILDANDFLIPIWFDSTVRQRFNTGLGTVNFSSVYQTIDPFANKTYNDAVFAGNIVINPAWNNYTIDSVMVTGAYIKMKARPTSVVDTLVLSVIPMDNITYYIPKTNATYGSKISNYTSKDTVWAFAPVNVDSVNRAAFPPTGGTRAYWKVPLTDADRDTVTSTGSVTVRNWTFALPSSLSIPFGQRFSVTATFKSGDTWTKNVDSVTNFHRFMPLFSQVASGSYMPYYRDVYGDRSMSGLMFSTDSSQYSPSLFIEIYNSSTYDKEFVAIGGYVNCPTCFILDVSKLAENISEVNAFPNPTQTALNIKFSLKEATETKVNITNAIGQVVMTQDMGNVSNGTATFQVENLANGVYFYTVDANGQRSTNRFVINH